MEIRLLILLFLSTQLVCTLPIALPNSVHSRMKDPATKWDFARLEEMRSLAHVDRDSIELVIDVETLTSGYQRLTELIEKHYGRIVNRVFKGHTEAAMTVDVPLATVALFVEEARAARLSAHIEPNLRYEALFTPDDTHFSEQWGLTAIGAPRAWDLTRGNSSILVAVVDTGIDWRHDDLADNYVSLGYDWVHGDPDPMDDNGHGTHVAGIIAAALNNSLGVAGVAQVSVMAEKGLDMKGIGHADDLAQAIFHAVDQGASIISMSWGDYEDSWLVRRAIVEAYRAGVLLVAAAGNDATSERMYPAAYDEVIAVTATDQTDQPASFTNYGDWVELSAPGVSVLSTLPNDGYGTRSGTSMATPYVAGVAALFWSQYPNRTRDEVRSRLASASDDLGDPEFDHFYGYGRVNAKETIDVTNIAVSDVTLQKSVVGQGFTVEVNVSVTNFGLDSETFEVAIWINVTILEARNVTLEGLSYALLSVAWNTTNYAKGNYAVSVYALPVADEASTEDNWLMGDEVFVTLPGDADGDRDVDIFDIVRMAGTYGINVPDSRYDPNSDWEGDGDVDIFDIVTATTHYGENW